MIFHPFLHSETAAAATCCKFRAQTATGWTIPASVWWSAKTAKRANERNYMKRVIRDWFRLNKNRLPPQDFVVRVRRKFDRATAKQARAELAQLMFGNPATGCGKQV